MTRRDGGLELVEHELRADGGWTPVVGTCGTEEQGEWFIARSSEVQLSAWAAKLGCACQAGDSSGEHHIRLVRCSEVLVAGGRMLDC